MTDLVLATAAARRLRRHPATYLMLVAIAYVRCQQCLIAVMAE
jgi:hypothetical protein